MILPNDFLSDMKTIFNKNDYDLFLRCYDKPYFKGLRVNSLKINLEKFRKIFEYKLKPSPFYENGFLHRMFPMEDYVILLWDVVLILGVCISSGAFFFYRVRGKFHYPLVIAGLFLLLELSHIYSVLVATVLLGVMYYFTLRSIWIRGDMREI